MSACFRGLLLANSGPSAQGHRREAGPRSCAVQLAATPPVPQTRRRAGSASSATTASQPFGAERASARSRASGGSASGYILPDEKRELGGRGTPYASSTSASGNSNRKRDERDSDRRSSTLPGWFVIPPRSVPASETGTPSVAGPRSLSLITCTDTGADNNCRLAVAQGSARRDRSEQAWRAAQKR
jgi:hypothetical protein